MEVFVGRRMCIVGVEVEAKGVKGSLKRVWWRRRKKGSSRTHSGNNYMLMMCNSWNRFTLQDFLIQDSSAFVIFHRHVNCGLLGILMCEACESFVPAHGCN